MIYSDFDMIRVLAELQKLDGLPVIRGDQEEEEASHSLPSPSDNRILKIIEK